jgi:hypothetical protein
MHLVLNSPADTRDFMALDAKSRMQVERWAAALESVTRPIQRSLETIAARFGVSVPTVRRRYDAWRSTRDFRALLDRRSLPTDRGLSPETIEYWKSLCAENGRKWKPAHRELQRRWHRGDSIPGIDPTLPRTSLPKGLSYHNLVRFAPSRFETTALRIGRTAAASFRPLVFSTRVGMEVGQRYVFDDLWHDFKVAVLGQRKPCRLLQLHAMDLFSGCQVARLCKPRVEDPESGQSVQLKEHEMLFLVVHVLEHLGFHPGGCVLMVENGTAAIADDLKELIRTITGGLVTVDESGIQSASAFAGQYGGRGKGNFRFKAALESSGNLIHNETANLLELPGQTGSNSRINLPEELHGREKAFDFLQRVIAALPESKRAELRLPFVEFHRAVDLVNDIQERINARTEHELEGWLEAGLTTVDFNLPGVGLITGSQVLALPSEKRAAVEAVAAPVARRLSPKEVWDGGRRQLIRLRPEQSARLLGGRVERTVKVRNHLIEFQDQRVAPGPLRFLAHTFQDGDEFGVVVNPFSPEVAHLFDAKGSWVGSVKAWQSVSKLDADALQRQMGRSAEIERQLLEPLARHGAAMIRKRIEDSQHNAQLIRGQAAAQDDSTELAEDSLSRFGQ